jgi:acetaldehyde dehydrogenase/alcohol dehydrogenase
VLLPHVIAYNAQKPEKFPIFPKYSEFVADYRYAQIARNTGLSGDTQEKQIAALIKKIQDMMKEMNLPMTIKDCGVDEKEFLAKVEMLAERAFEDQCTTANPRYPLIKDLEEIYKKAYYGK